MPTLRPVVVNVTIPDEPDWADIYAQEKDRKYASRQWANIIREMEKSGILSVGNEDAIKRLVQFRVQFQSAASHVAEHGAIMAARRTGTPMLNVHWQVMRQADDAVKGLEAELGISAIRRSRIKAVKRDEKAGRRSDDYIKSVS